VCQATCAVPLKSENSPQGDKAYVDENQRVIVGHIMQGHDMIKRDCAGDRLLGSW
jgi:hypothetical protein